MLSLAAKAFKIHVSKKVNGQNGALEGQKWPEVRRKNFPSTQNAKMKEKNAQKPKSMRRTTLTQTCFS